MQAYRISIADVDGPKVAHADGDLDTIAYVARRAKDAMADAKKGTEFAVAVHALDTLGGTIIRPVVSVTADAEVAAYVLTKRVTAERKVNADEKEMDATPTAE